MNVWFECAWLYQIRMDRMFDIQKRRLIYLLSRDAVSPSLLILQRWPIVASALPPTSQYRLSETAFKLEIVGFKCKWLVSHQL
jgi:hypothetical protein